MSADLTPAVAAVLALVAPAIVSLLKRRGWPAAVNAAIALAVAFGAAAASVALTDGLGALSPERVSGYAGAIFTLAHLTYRLYFRETPLADALERAIWPER